MAGDVEWREEQAGIASRTHEWITHGRNRAHLLRGATLASAERWLTDSTDRLERPTPQEIEYITRSRRSRTSRLRPGVALMLVLTALLSPPAAVSWAERGRAVREVPRPFGRKVRPGSRRTCRTRGNWRCARTYLKEAERRLQRLDTLHPDSSETWGLLGSVAKRAFELALQLGEEKDVRLHLDRAIDAYRSGMAADPGDHYPGINALALLRLRGQHFGGGQGDVAEVESLLPVVRFAVERRQIGPGDTWEHASLAELALHRHLLDGETQEPPAEAVRHYAFAVQSADGAEISSMRRQLALFRAAGDPPAVLDPLLAAVAAPDTEE